MQLPQIRTTGRACAYLHLLLNNRYNDRLSSNHFLPVVTRLPDGPFERSSRLVLTGSQGEIARIGKAIQTYRQEQEHRRDPCPGSNDADRHRQHDARRLPARRSDSTRPRLVQGTMLVTHDMEMDQPARCQSQSRPSPNRIPTPTAGGQAAATQPGKQPAKTQTSDRSGAFRCAVICSHY